MQRDVDPLSKRAVNIVRASRTNDKTAGRVSTLEKQFVLEMIQKSCVSCGVSSESTVITLDRVDCALGHSPENVVPCCYVCNKIRQDLPWDIWQQMWPVLKASRSNESLTRYENVVLARKNIKLTKTGEVPAKDRTIGYNEEHILYEGEIVARIYSLLSGPFTNWRISFPSGNISRYLHVKERTEARAVAIGIVHEFFTKNPDKLRRVGARGVEDHQLFHDGQRVGRVYQRSVSKYWWFGFRPISGGPESRHSLRTENKFEAIAKAEKLVRKHFLAVAN